MLAEILESTKHHLNPLSKIYEFENGIYYNSFNKLYDLNILPVDFFSTYNFWVQIFFLIL